ncbi:MAG TPA: hypothetical protein VM076_11395 [Gemmatimonadaceae bacterium]|nr:hypothetical protein [Gemmatimonadaceae bacterium]
MTGILKVAKIVAINVVIFVVLFALIEGASSLLFVGNQIRRTRGMGEQAHSTHDSAIGWVNLPNVNLPNLYGEGVGLRTNAQAFRADREYTKDVPAGKTRIMCSGDSFTLGFGVSNADTWCSRLAALDPRLETVNLGQGGYGVDQAYLWYKRAGAPLDHQVQLLAFITDDFTRMQSERFLGYGKPKLEVRADSLATVNSPVPQTSKFERWRASQNHSFGNLNIVRLYTRLFHHDEDGPPPDSVAARNQATRQVLAVLFADLARINKAKNSQLVLVYLPGQSDYKTDRLAADWRAYIASEAARLGITYIDLVDDIRRDVKPTDLDSFYRDDAHYSTKGNAWVAGAIYKRLAPMIK